MNLIGRAEQIAAAPMDAAQEIEELHAKLRDADFRERELHEALRRETANALGTVERAERAEAELAKVEPVMVAACRVFEAYEAMIEGRDVGRLPDWTGPGVLDAGGGQ